MKKNNVLNLFAIFSVVICGCDSNKNDSESVSQTSSVIDSSSSIESSSEDTPKTTAKELTSKLVESAEANSSLATGYDGFGLSNPESVGVLSDNKNIIEAKDSSYYTKIVDFNAISLSDIKDYYPTASEVNDYYAFATCINLAKDNSNGKTLIKLPNKELQIPSTYSEASAMFTIEGLKNVDIIGDNTIFNVEYVNFNFKSLFAITSCENLSIKGVSMDAKYPSSIAGQIKTMDVEKNTSTVSFEPSCNDVIELAVANNKRLMEYLEFDVNTKAPLKDGNFVDSGAFKGYVASKNEKGGYDVVVEFNNQITRSRNKSYVALAFSEYDKPAMSVSNVTNYKMEDVNIYSCAGMGIVITQSNDIHLNRTNVRLKENSNSLLTATADGMHFNSLHGDVVVENSIIENTHDDALNIKHGYWYSLKNADNQTKKLTVSKLTSGVSNIKVGDKFIIYDETTFEGHNPASGYYTVSAISGTEAEYEITITGRFTNVSSWGQCRVSFLNDTPNFVFRNNIVRNKRNRGILIQVPNALVENNCFENIGHGSIQAASAMDKFNECTIPNNLTIRNNKFIRNIFLQPEPLYGDISVFAISKNASVAPKNTITGINIENNFFTENGNAAISLRGVGKSSIKNNLFSDCSKYQVSGDQLNCLVSGYNAGEISLANNYNYYTLNKGLSGIYLQGLSTEDDFTLTENSNIEFYKSTEVGPNVDIKKATGSITIDGNLAEWETIGATPIDFIGSSLATGDEISLSSIEDHFKINKGYITYNDNGIYMAFDVFDDTIDCKPAANFWTGDCVEILATTLTSMPSADTSVYKEEGGVAQLAFAPTWTASNYCTLAKVRSNSKYNGCEKNLEVSFNSTATGYTLEFCLPFSVFGEFKTAIDNKNRIAIAIIVADCERLEDGLTRVQVGNVPHFVENYKTKSELMPLYLFD